MDRDLPTSVSNLGFQGGGAPAQEIIDRNELVTPIPVAQVDSGAGDRDVPVAVPADGIPYAIKVGHDMREAGVSGSVRDARRVDTPAPFSDDVLQREPSDESRVPQRY